MKGFYITFALLLTGMAGCLVAVVIQWPVT
jgi:hypothetical protein